MAGQQASIKLYKSFIAEASKFPDFNFRTYFVRRVQDCFYSGSELRSEAEIDVGLGRAGLSLELLQRQAAIGGMYQPVSTPSPVVE